MSSKDRIEYLYPGDSVGVLTLKFNRLVNSMRQSQALADEMLKHIYPTRKVVAEGDAVDHPPHYNQVPGIECIDVVKWFNYNQGAAMKYLWRAGHKEDTIEDLRKAIRYIEYEIERLEEVQRADKAVQALQEEGAED